MLELRKVVRRYGGKEVLKGISLRVKKGESLSIVGPNGSGKTTLLRVMALLDPPDEGEVECGVERGKITMVFQQPVFFNTTVYHNLAYGLKLRGYPEEEVRREVKRALSLVGMGGCEGRKAVELSGGEKQRIALARALVLKPELLLLDEPTSNLDPENSRMIEEVIEEMGKECTLVLATNHPFQAFRLSERMVYLLEGRILAQGKPEEILKRRMGKFLKGEWW
ncbi:MAG: ATP-binding cassette domain-containing protein [Candidatus Hadarchaeales archaeon]